MTLAANSLDDLRSLLRAEAIGEREGKTAVSPQTTEEVAAITRYANEHKMAIEIVGAGTKRSWGNPVSADILLETTRIAGVRQHRSEERRVGKECRSRWSPY